METIKLVWRYSQESISSYKIIAVILISCVVSLNTIFQLRYVGRFNDITILDGMLYEFGLYTLYYLIIVPTYLFCIYDAVKPNPAEDFIYPRIGNRKKLFQIEVLSCIITSIIFFCIFVITSLLIFIFNLTFDIRLGDSMLLSQSITGEMINNSLINYPPLLSIIFQLILEQLSLIAFGLLLLLFMKLWKKKGISFAISIIIVFIMLVVEKSGSLSHFILPTHNIFIKDLDASSFGAFTFVFPVIYWIAIHSIISFADFQIIMRKDCLNRDEEASENQ